MRRISLILLALVALFAVQVFAEETPSSAEEARRARVFATVGSATITVGDLEDQINARSPYARKRFTEPEVLKTLGDDQVRNELFYQGAEKLGYADDPEVARFHDQTLIQLFVRKEFEETVKPDAIAEKDIADYYEEHPEEFRRPAMRRARHILVGSKK